MQHVIHHPSNIVEYFEELHYSAANLMPVCPFLILSGEKTNANFFMYQKEQPLMSFLHINNVFELNYAPTLRLWSVVKRQDLQRLSHCHFATHFHTLR